MVSLHNPMCWLGCPVATALLSTPVVNNFLISFVRDLLPHFGRQHRPGPSRICPLDCCEAERQLQYRLDRRHWHLKRPQNARNKHPLDFPSDYANETVFVR